ncbi:MAG: hypothetical protein JSR24_22465 [Proteobacteria bacterium]|nr:hypothetical protein [Pseudomonadota bacterium]
MRRGSDSWRRACSRSLVAAHLVVETGGAPFATDARLDRHAGCALIEVSSGYPARKRADGKTKKEAFRCLKRHLVPVVWWALEESPGAAAVPG